MIAVAKLLVAPLVGVFMFWVAGHHESPSGRLIPAAKNGSALMAARIGVYDASHEINRPDEAKFGHLSGDFHQCDGTRYLNFMLLNLASRQNDRAEIVTAIGKGVKDWPPVIMVLNDDPTVDYFTGIISSINQNKRDDLSIIAGPVKAGLTNDYFRTISGIELSLRETNLGANFPQLTAAHTPQCEGKNCKDNGRKCCDRSVVGVDIGTSAADKRHYEMGLVFFVTLGGFFIWLWVFTLLERWGNRDGRGNNQ